MNVQKLKGKIVERGLNVGIVAEQLGIDRCTLYRKLSNCGETITIGEAKKLSKALELTEEEATAIFLR